MSVWDANRCDAGQISKMPHTFPYLSYIWLVGGWTSIMHTDAPMNKSTGTAGWRCPLSDSNLNEISLAWLGFLGFTYWAWHCMPQHWNTSCVQLHFWIGVNPECLHMQSILWHHTKHIPKSLSAHKCYWYMMIVWNVDYNIGVRYTHHHHPVFV